MAPGGWHSCLGPLGGLAVSLWVRDAGRGWTQALGCRAELLMLWVQGHPERGRKGPHLTALVVFLIPKTPLAKAGHTAQQRQWGWKGPSTEQLTAVLCPLAPNTCPAGA